MSQVARKFVFVGDAACGKVHQVAHPTSFYFSMHASNIEMLQTCMVIVFCKGTFPEVCVLRLSDTFHTRNQVL